MCSRHYPEVEDHRCFICKDKFRREMDESDVEILSEIDDIEVILFKKEENRTAKKVNLDSNLATMRMTWNPCLFRHRNGMDQQSMFMKLF